MNKLWMCSDCGLIIDMSHITIKVSDTFDINSNVLFMCPLCMIHGSLNKGKWIHVPFYQPQSITVHPQTLKPSKKQMSNLSQLICNEIKTDIRDLRSKITEDMKDFCEHLMDIKHEKIIE